MTRPAPEERCLTDGDHEVDLDAGTIAVVGGKLFLDARCSLCGAWATLSASDVRLEWGEPED